MRKIPYQPKGIFYYALIIENPVEGKAGIPVAEMITNDQHASEIKRFLSRFPFLVSKERSIASVVPQRVETVFSWALLQSVLHAFNNEDCKGYLKRTYKIVHGDVQPSLMKGINLPTHMRCPHAEGCFAKIKSINNRQAQEAVHPLLLCTYADPA